MSDDSEQLERIREQLDEVNELDVTERPEVFAAINDALAAELSAMEDE